MERIGHIYKITSPTGGVYIGKTVRLKERLSNYKYCSGISEQKMLYNSIKKHGWESHTFEVLVETIEIDNLSNLEIQYIKEFNTYHYNNSKGMNLTLGGDGTLGRKVSEETKKKMIRAHIGSKRSEETKKLMSSLKKGKPSNRVGYVCSEETKQKVSKANKGKIHSSETIEKRKNSFLRKMLNDHDCILQIDITNNKIIKEWYILPNDINKHFGVTYSNIRKCLKGQKSHSLGYKWKYKK
jgi:group I intron endonuclease